MLFCMYCFQQVYAHSIALLLLVWTSLLLVNLMTRVPLWIRPPLFFCRVVPLTLHDFFKSNLKLVFKRFFLQYFWHFSDLSCPPCWKDDSLDDDASGWGHLSVCLLLWWWHSGAYCCHSCHWCAIDCSGRIAHHQAPSQQAQACTSWELPLFLACQRCLLDRPPCHG